VTLISFDLGAGSTSRRPLESDGPMSDREPTRPKLPRKEVIQPHLPVRLPCYDFTPLTERTLGAFSPCGLEQRLLVPPTRVV
jgi:hypothetical protein